MSSSRLPRTQLYGVPLLPEDSSTTLPAIAVRPFQQRSSSGYSLT
ncbi:hypothetical protein ACFQZC_11480 [Streptacidiphilus monticola]